jgi:enolase
MSRPTIAAVNAWEALDSRGTPTVAAVVTLADGTAARAIVPSGASTGRHEAHELRDGGERYGGRGVRRAVANVRGEIASAVTGLDVRETRALDDRLRELDGTATLSRLGANATLAVSVAAAIAAARSERQPLYRWLLGGGRPLLPLPMVNVVSGGAHAAGAVDLQDFLAVPVAAASFAEAIEWAWRVREAVRLLVAEQGHSAALVADEGGLAPQLATNRAALELVVEAIGRAGLRPGKDVVVAIDVAATQLATPDGRYALRREERVLASEELAAELASWCAREPVCSLEDPLGEDDWDGWRDLTRTLGDTLQLVGDDLFATDVDRVGEGIDRGVANAVLVKPNQAGTLTGAADVVTRARAAGYATIVSARSGDTEDAWLADLAVAWRAGQIKVGSTTRSERTAKWNRLLELESELRGEAEFAGGGALAGWAGGKDR